MVIDTVHVLKDTALCESVLTQMDKVRGDGLYLPVALWQIRFKIEAGIETRSSDLYLNDYQLDNSACEECSLQTHGLIWAFGMVLK